MKTAEQPHATKDFLEWDSEFSVSQVNTALLVEELEINRYASQEAERLIGSIALGKTVQTEQDDIRTAGSLRDSIRRASQGDKEALCSLKMNVRTDVIERSVKAGHVIAVEQFIDEYGHLTQHGQSGRSIQENSLRFASQNPAMLERTVPEVRNLFRIEWAYAEGLLEDNYFVVVSRPSDNMSDEAMRKAGFFVDTMSIAIQATTANGKGGITTESAFVAGKRNSTAQRHDVELVGLLANRVGINVAGQSASQTIDSPWLIPKRLMPNGAIDLVAFADEPMGTFFGQDKIQQDYASYREQCKEREAELEPVVEEIVAALIARADTLNTPLDATDMLHNLSETMLVRLAVTDEKIDAMVFGPEAAHHIEAARYYNELGDFEKAASYTVKAENSADSSSCPGAGSPDRNANKVAGNSNVGDDADCEYISKQCPLCKKKNVKTTDKKIAGNKRRIEGDCGCTLNYTKNANT